MGWLRNAVQPPGSRTHGERKRRHESEAEHGVAHVKGPEAEGVSPDADHGEGDSNLREVFDSDNPSEVEVFAM